MNAITYGKKIKVRDDFETALQKTIAALKAQGFGVLTEIDVKKTMKAKLDLNFKRYVILGACNPRLAHQALTAEEDLGLLLPCNVVVYEQDGGGSVVAMLDPKMMSSVTANPALADVAEKAGALLDKALAEIEAA
jgi:uncharacterized protein (DUF302 family)